MDRISQLHGIDPYVLMGLRNSAGDADVKRAYKRCALRCHPDKFVNKSEAHKKDAKTRFERLTAARDVLLDKTARAAYDHATHRCPRCPYNQFCAVGPDGIWRARCAKCSPIVQPTPIDATVMRACYNVQTKMQKLNQTITALDAIIRKHSTTARTLKRKRKKYDLEIAAAEAAATTHAAKRATAFQEYKNLAATSADLELHAAEIKERLYAR